MSKNILLKPIITEKMTLMSEKLNKYGFIVSGSANKFEIKEAVEQMYGVNVANVNTVVVPPKRKSRYTKSGVISGKTKSFKKAIVTLDANETIDFFENV